jgi:hypothetical protein
MTSKIVEAVKNTFSNLKTATSKTFENLSKADKDLQEKMDRNMRYASDKF